MNKTCFKCGKSKPLSEYYGHPAMGDGTLGKCKVCVRLAVAARIIEKQKDPVWVAKERERCRLKTERYRKLGLVRKYSKAYLNAVQRRARSKYPEKNRARGILGKAVRSGKVIRKTKCEGCGCGDSKLHGHRSLQGLETEHMSKKALVINVRAEITGWDVHQISNLLHDIAYRVAHDAEGRFLPQGWEYLPTDTSLAWLSNDEMPERKPDSVPDWQGEGPA